MEGWNSSRCAPHPSGQGRLLCSWFEKPASSSRYLCILQHWLGSFIAHGLSCQHPDPVIQCRMCCRGLVVYDLRERDRRWRTHFVQFFFFPSSPSPSSKSWPSKQGATPQNLQFSRRQTSLMISAVSHCPTPAKIERSPGLVAHSTSIPQEMSQPGRRIVRDSVETAIASEKLTSLPERQLPASSQHKKRSASQEHSRYLIEGPM